MECHSVLKFEIKAKTTTTKTQQNTLSDFESSPPNYWTNIKQTGHKVSIGKVLLNKGPIQCAKIVLIKILILIFFSYSLSFSIV